MKAASLLSVDRLDIIPRLRMARAIVNGHVSLDFKDYFSREYLSYFSHLSGNSRILDESGSYTVSERLMSFVATVNSIRSQGFQKDISRVAVLESDPSFLTNGAHRVAACIALGEGLEIDTNLEPNQSRAFRDVSETSESPLENTSHVSLGPAFHRRIGFSDDFVRELIVQYSRQTKKPRFILLFDRRESLGDVVEQQLQRQARILDRINIDLTRDGLCRLIHMAYQLQDWWDPSYVQDIAKSTTGLNKEKFASSIYIFEPINKKDPHSIKLDIRAHIEKLGDNGRLIHGSDDWTGTEFVLDLILSKPGRHFLNSAPYMAEVALIERLNSIQKGPGVDGLSLETVVVGSAILEIYGLRKARDIDYISRKNLSEDFEWGNRVGDYLRSNSITLDEALCDSNYQFSLMGIKFQSLEAYCMIQEERVLTKKGRDDFVMAKALLEASKTSFFRHLGLSLRKLRWWSIVTIWRCYGLLGSALPEFIKGPLRPIVRVFQKK